MDRDQTLPGFADQPGDADELLAKDRVFLLAVAGPHSGSVFTLIEGKMVIGRHPGADIFLNDTQVSRKHAQITTQEGGFRIADLGSTNGTFVNGDQLAQDHELNDGDEIQIGATVFAYSVQNPLDQGRLGVRSHGYFETRVAEELDRAARYKRPLSVMMIDLDAREIDPDEKEDFLRRRYSKSVEYIHTIIRTMDLIAHYGKYELELLLPETNKKEALRLAQRINNEKVVDPNLVFSLGIATFPEDGQSSDILIQRSREALKLARQKKTDRIVQLKEEVRRVLVSNQEVIIKSEKMSQLFELAQRIAKSTITVLIQGETGVGKEVVAQTIHNHSDRAQKPLVCVNCAALTETLLESELFGHEKGSFTGAEQTKIGLFESAKGGTIFLDEIGEMPQKTQAKLLRVLQSRRIMRVGSNREIDTDVRIVAATNRKLEELVAKGAFREDLFYRLNAATIVVPPLRERRDEIPYLVEAFIQKCCKENNFPIKQISPDAMDVLVRYQWPGNIRELGNAMERAVIISEGETIYKDSLTGKLTSDSFEYVEGPPTGASAVAAAPTAVGDIKEIISVYEREIIVNALKRVNWNQTKAANILNLPRRTLVSKIKKHGIKRS